MTTGGFGNGNVGVRLGILIKTRFDAADTEIGFDVYKVYDGFTIAHAQAGTNGCESHYYDALGATDVIVVVTAEDMGFGGAWAKLCPNFRLSMAELWSETFI